MRRLALEFLKPYRVSVKEEPVAAPNPNQVLVETIVSAISPGTELLVYRGQWPDQLAVDDSIESLAGKFAYPLKYGYSAVGRVTAVGSEGLSGWLGRLVFSFNPHESAFVVSPDILVPLPESLAPETAAFLPNMETAVNFLMDGRPIIGERVLVLGQGVVGLLTTALLAGMPLSRLITVDGFALRREKSRALGADETLDPTDPDIRERLAELLALADATGGSDLTYEISGNPAALDLAVAATGFAGRIVIGSWYGAKRADVDLGGRFHRSRIRVYTSQVSTLSPEFTGRWTKTRRLDWALTMLAEVNPAPLITHRFPISRAAEAYSALDEHPDEAVQVLLTYEDA